MLVKVLEKEKYCKDAFNKKNLFGKNNCLIRENRILKKHLQSFIKLIENEQEKKLKTQVSVSKEFLRIGGDYQ